MTRHIAVMIIFQGLLKWQTIVMAIVDIPNTLDIKFEEGKGFDIKALNRDLVH